jgi:hypothetical protein
MSNVMIGSILPVGTILHSMLTLPQFQSVSGAGWVIADGQSVSGSKYHALTGLSNIPDMRGKVLRGKNNGIAGSSGNPDGELALGSFQDDSFGAHSHVERYVGYPGFPAVEAYKADVVLDPGSGTATLSATGSYILSTTEKITTSDSGSNETRMKNTTVNIFIKIN